MSQEIEAKMTLHDRAAVEQRLQDLQATHVATYREVNKFFDTRESRLRTTDQGLRIREAMDLDSGVRSVIITHKGPREQGKLKTRSETEVTVADSVHNVTVLLHALGFYETLSFEKRRKRYTLNQCVIELDTLPYLGDFIEIEGPDEARIMAVRKELALSDEPLIQSSYAAMLKSYLIERQIQTQHVALDTEGADSAPTANPA